MIDSVLDSQCCTISKEIARSDLSGTAKGAVDKAYRTRKAGLLEFKTKIIWSTALLLFVLHAFGIYGILTFDYLKDLKTTSWIFVMHVLTVFGVAGGAHRLWSHKSYKAKLPLRILLFLLFTAAGQNSICKWVRNHRLHHKFCDTDADPHNITRGFFFSHIGWIIMEEHPKLLKKSKKIDLSDILSDPVVAFSEKYFLQMQLIFGFVLPTIVPVYFWNETWSRAIISQVFIRYIITLNTVWTLNSLAHSWGYRPYDRHIKPADNKMLNLLSLGEGFHNYHHTFPWDYRSADLSFVALNCTTFFLDVFVKLGLVYDLKSPSRDLIKKVVKSRGDGSYPMDYEVPVPSCN